MMTVVVLSDAGKTITYDKVEIDNLVGNGYAVFRTESMRRVIVEVLTGAWVADTTNPPVPAGETWHYADLVHGLASNLVRAVAGTGHDGFLIDGMIQMQQIVSAGILRIWIAFATAPAYTTKWLVIG